MTNKQTSKQERYRQFKENYAAELPEKLARIDQSWRDIFEPSADVEKRLYEFRRLIHSLAGSAGSFGFSQLGKQALRLEKRLDQLVLDTLPDSESKKLINENLQQIQQLAEQGPEFSETTELDAIEPHPELQGEHKHLVYIVEDDELFCQQVADQIEQYGYEVNTFTTIKAAEAAIEKKIPSAMVIDVEFPEGTLAGPRLAKQYQPLRNRNIPLIFMSVGDDWQSRLAAVQAGGSAYITKPFDFIMLVDRLDNLLEIKQQRPYRILIVDDVTILAEHYANVLQAEGMITHIVTDPAKLLIELQEFKPELILMDIYMPGVSGIDAARVIRQTDAYLNVPIVYLSTESGLDQQLEALRLGGDDFLQKPIHDEHLAAAIKIRVGRFRNLSTLMIRDGLTGLLNHITLKLELEGAIAQSIRNKSPLSFAMLDIDHFKEVNDKYGHPVGDLVIKSLARLLQQRLRSSDVVARYGGEEFSIILPDTDPAVAKKVLEQLRQDFANTKHSCDLNEFTVSFSAGIASVPEHNDLQALINAADEALYEAKHAGRNCIAMDTT